MGGPGHAPAEELGTADYVRALVNILEDFAGEKARLQLTQRAILNILDDFLAEKQRLESTQKAVLNILEDFGLEKHRLENTQKAILNILDDLGVERDRLEKTQHEVMASERAIRASLVEKEVLLKEIHHRVKNNLQVTSSLLKLQSSYVQDPRTRELFAESQNRIRSMALVHEKLYQSRELSRVDFPDYTRSLSGLLFRSFGADPQRIRLQVDAGEVFLSIESAVPCGLILSELLSNCLKHAFPGDRPGRIEVTMAGTERGLALLAVRDDGVGLPPSVDVQKSETLGLQLVSMLVEQLHGRLEVLREGGTEFRIHFQDEDLRHGA